MDEIKQEMQDLHIIPKFEEIKCEKDRDSVLSELKIESEKIMDFPSQYLIAQEKLINCILHILHFYERRGLRNIATMNLHCLLLMYRDWDQLCRNYLINRGMAAINQRLLFDLPNENISLRKLRATILLHFEGVNRFSLMMQNGPNTDGHLRWNILMCCSGLETEFKICIDKMNYYRANYPDAMLSQTIIPKLHDSLEWSIEDLFPDLYNKLFI